MSTAQQNHFLNTADEHEQAIVSIIEALSRTYGLDRVWSDWIEISAIALARADRAQFEAREARYLSIVKHYDKKELDGLVQAFAHLVMALEKRVENGQITDVLGKIFMMLNMGNSNSGQFFTPFDISLTMAQIIMPKNGYDIIRQRGYIRLAEPTAGAGGMIIAYAKVMADAGHNYQRELHVTATDIDSRCVHMTFIQLALLNIPAVVIHGNSLTVEEWRHWYTPAHILGGWNWKLLRSETVNKQPDTPEPELIKPAPSIENLSTADQLQLF